MQWILGRYRYRYWVFPRPRFGRWLARVLGLAAILFFLVACGEQPPTEPASLTPTASGEAGARNLTPGPRQDAGYEPGRVLVRFQPGSDGAAIAAAHGASLARPFIPGAWIARVPAGRELAVAQALARNPGVAFAEPDYRRVFNDPLCPECDRPTDELFEWQWNMHNDGYVDLGLGLGGTTGQVDGDIDWLEAFDLLGPSPQGAVKIGVLDTGIRSTHQDFCGKSVTWRNFYDPASTTPVDDHGHGTHVSGIAGACANNTSGVVGVAYGPNMEFVVGKVCAADGTCLASAIAEAIVWAADNGANVLNMSFGDTQQSQAEADALAYAAGRNVLPVCAAGNDGIRAVLFPAADPNCVAVSATDWGDELASYSSYGPQVEVSAPGGDTEDFFIGTSMIVSTWRGFDTDYVSTAGTSMAAPHVTGLAALLWSLGLDNAQDVRSCLRSTADDLGPAGWDESFGWGRINMHQAVLNWSACVGGGGGGGGEPGENVAPSASFVRSCDALSCTFEGGGSWDPDGQVVAWDWTFGDGATGSGEMASHTYDAPGTYTVGLTVTDDQGATGTESVTFSLGSMHVGGLDGWSEAGKGNRWRAFLEVTVVDNSGSPVSGAAVSVGWAGDALGQDTRLTDAAGVASFATANIRGAGAVTFTVTGVTHGSMVHAPDLDVARTLVVESPNDAPQADFVESCGELVCSFTDTSSDPDGEIVSWFWEFGDGATSTEASPTHTYAGSGDRFVQLTVTDDKGATASRARIIFVPDLGLEIVLTASTTKLKGSNEVHLAWEFSDPLAMEIRRDGSVIHTTDGSTPTWTDVLGRKVNSSYTYQVCVELSSVCSNEVTVSF